VAERLGMDLEAYQQVLKDAASCRVFSLDELTAGDEGAPREPIDEGGEGPEARVERDAFRSALAEAISALPERERLVVAMYYDEELNLREIGEVLGVSESRVCQIHGQATMRLRAKLRDWLRTEG